MQNDSTQSLHLATTFRLLHTEQKWEGQINPANKIQVIKQINLNLSWKFNKFYDQDNKLTFKNPRFIHTTKMKDSGTLFVFTR